MEKPEIALSNGLSTMQLVWFKRDLRLEDHAALHGASTHGPVLGLVVYEPTLWEQPDSSGRHAAFYMDCLVEFRQACRRAGLPLLLACGEMPDLLAELLQYLGPFCLHSHEETGNWASYARDRRVVEWCRQTQTRWLQCPQNNVVRGLKNRDDWQKVWAQRMSQSCLAVPDFQPLDAAQSRMLSTLPDCFRQDDLAPWLHWARKDNCPGRLTGGRLRGQAHLKGFLSGRGLHYRSQMSNPLTAETSCSRLSPYLTWGVLSVREVVHAAWNALREWREEQQHPGHRSMLLSLRSFESRLHWRCHFIQKLESEPEIEFRCLHPSTRGLRNEEAFDEKQRQLFEAWVNGLTGLPFVDACMRYLNHHGWINFRMRAMLISFASQHLWLHWRETGAHLARGFVDYEPGIHWPQIQMQSGTTGINTIRIYNPVKQALDHDPHQIFTKRWLPEYGTSAYPDPVVDSVQAARLARERLWALRRTSQASEEAQAVFQKHGSRKRARQGPKNESKRSSPESHAKQMGFDF